MRYEYVLHPFAQEEYEAAVARYAEISEKLAGNFVESVNHALVLICNNPYRWKLEFKNHYVLGLKKFPFTIVYTVNEPEKEIAVLAIYHQKRNPRKKFRKTP